MTGAELIAEERDRHHSKCGWTDDHDDLHVCCELPEVAAILAANDTTLEVVDASDGRTIVDDRWHLLSKHENSRIRQLVIAGALIAAEIDRLCRQESRRAEKASDESSI
jgi:hypothetical protein